MEKSFRDILSQMLEAEKADSPSENTHFSSEIPADFAAHTAAQLHGWRPSQRENPSVQRVLRYKSQAAAAAAPSEKLTPAVEPAPPPPAVEMLIPLEKLDKDSRIMVGILLDLGAEELKSGVSLTRVKKSYRRLAKKFHPDRLSAQATVEQREKAKTAFFRLQKAYDFLSDSLREEELTEAA